MKAPVIHYDDTMIPAELKARLAQLEAPLAKTLVIPVGSTAPVIWKIETHSAGTAYVCLYTHTKSKRKIAEFQTTTFMSLSEEACRCNAVAICRTLSFCARIAAIVYLSSVVSCR